jgi:glycosidase
VVKTADWNPQTATLTVPARTTAVFVEHQVGSYEYILPLIFKNAYWGSSDEVRSLVTPPVMHPIQDDIFYFVLPDRFDNGDTSNDFGGQPGGETVEDIMRHGFLPTDKGYYHGGDLAGLMARLDYLQNLGVTAIWMTPVFENRPVQGDGTIAGSSASYHGYWITNFDRVDPHLGTNQELADLIAAAHSRDMKVFFDIVTNHTGDVIRYEEGEYVYRSLEDYPYRDANGNIFDPADYAGTESFPPLDPAVSFPYTPVFDNEADATAKSPAWLNNPIYYHNRGDSTFAGESSLFGDFFGLDDLFTEHPVVVDGMIDIYKSWISDYKVDGFRIDTVKHVNIEFWQKFGPEIMAHAQAEGIDHFYMFGEVFDGNPAVMSHFTTVGQLPATLDFGLQGRAISFAGGGNAADLQAFFAADDYYTDVDSSAYGLANFTGNHDMGRAAWMLGNQVSGATESELVQRTMLAYGLTFFARGFPVIYYGDEQGFIGEGGDKDARQNMMPSQVASYNANNLLATDATTAEANFDQNHPMYRQFQAFADVRTQHKALRQGSQIHRYAAPGAGVYAFSRFDREERVEYIVALNNARVPNRASFQTYSVNGSFAPVYPASGPTLATTDQGMISVDVPPLSLVIYRATAPIHRAADLPGDEETRRTPLTMRFINPQDGVIAGRAEVGVDLVPDRYTEVTFAVKVGDATEWTILGTDTNYPYRVFYDVSSLPISTTLRFMAVANPFTDRLWTTETEAVVVAEASLAGAGYAVIHYHRPDGDYDGWGLHLWGDAIAEGEATTWQEAKLPNGESAYGKFWFVQLKDASQPVNFIIHKGDEKDTDPDRSFIPAQDREIWVFSGNETNHASMAAATGQAIIHYKRTDGEYDGWGLHLWGPGLAPGAETEWNDAKMPDGEDGYGKYFIVPISNPAQPVNFIIHKGDEKDTDLDRSFVPNERPEIWLLQGDETLHSHPGAVESYAILHYHRPAGDYDGWGLHLWAGSAEPGVEWNTPLQPTGMDAFGQVYRVRLTQGALELAYILHKGDEKDLPDDQFLRLRQDGHEVWIVQGTPGYLPVTPNRLP